MFLRFFCWGTNWWTSSAAANTATHCSPPKTPAFSELGKQTATRGEEWIFHHALNLAPKKLETVEPPLNLSKNLSLTSPSTNRLHDAVGASKKHQGQFELWNSSDQWVCDQHSSPASPEVSELKLESQRWCMKMWIVFEIVLRAVPFVKKYVFVKVKVEIFFFRVSSWTCKEEMGKRKPHRRFGKPYHSILPLQSVENKNTFLYTLFHSHFLLHKKKHRFFWGRIFLPTGRSGGFSCLLWTWRGMSGGGSLTQQSNLIALHLGDIIHANHLDDQKNEDLYLVN